MADSLHIGVIVSGGVLDICTSAGEAWRCTNDPAGIGSLVQRLSGRRIECIAVAASGGNAASVAAELNAAYLPVTLVTPDQVRDFVKTRSRSRHAFALDAVVLMKIAQTIKPQVGIERGPLIQTY